MQAAQPRLEKLDRDAMRRRVPPLTTHCEHGLFDAEGGDLNVHAILQGYRRQLRQNGADLRVDAEVIAVTSLGQGLGSRLRQWPDGASGQSCQCCRCLGG